jgi:methylthioribose-1-phosphate isomerase
MVKAIEWTDGKVVILDQSKLPLEVTFVDCIDYHMVADCIRTLKIRGAPAIGIAAAMGISIGAQEIRADIKEFMKPLSQFFEKCCPQDLLQ